MPSASPCWETSWGAQMVHSGVSERRHSALCWWRAPTECLTTAEENKWGSVITDKWRQNHHRMFVLCNTQIAFVCFWIFFVLVVFPGHARLEICVPGPARSHHMHRTSNPGGKCVHHDITQFPTKGHFGLTGWDEFHRLYWLTLPIFRWSLFLASSWKRSHSFSIFGSGKEIP